MTVETQVLVAAGHVFHKDTQTRIGRVINCGYHDFITLFCEYQTGDETDCEIEFHVQRTDALNDSQGQGWTVAAGDKTATLNQYTLTDAVPHYITFDVRGIAFCYFSAAGKTGDGTPTGTIEAAYTLK